MDGKDRILAQFWHSQEWVSPSIDTILNCHTRRSMDFPFQSPCSLSGSRSAGEAEASSAGEQLAEE
jgi:hypothetical protein